MIEINTIQGSSDWLLARAGHLTASAVSRILTPTLKQSSQAEEYAAELAAERILGEPYERFAGNEATERGHELEGDALNAYEFMTGERWRSVGTCRHSGLPWVSVSPDGLIGDSGGAEVKCPFVPAKHILYLVGEGVPRAYMHQIQFSLWVTGRSYWDFVSFYPGLPLFQTRAVVLPEYSDAYARAVPVFLEQVAELVATIEERHGIEAALGAPFEPKEAA